MATSSSAATIAVDPKNFSNVLAQIVDAKLSVLAGAGVSIVAVSVNYCGEADARHRFRIRLTEKTLGPVHAEEGVPSTPVRGSRLLNLLKGRLVNDGLLHRGTWNQTTGATAMLVDENTALECYYPNKILQQIYEAMLRQLPKQAVVAPASPPLSQHSPAVPPSSPLLTPSPTPAASITSLVLADVASPAAHSTASMFVALVEPASASPSSPVTPHTGGVRFASPPAVAGTGATSFWAPEPHSIARRVAGAVDDIWTRSMPVSEEGASAGSPAVAKKLEFSSPRHTASSDAAAADVASEIAFDGDCDGTVAVADVAMTRSPSVPVMAAVHESPRATLPIATPSGVKSILRVSKSHFGRSTVPLALFGASRSDLDADLMIKLLAVFRNRKLGLRNCQIRVLELATLATNRTKGYLTELSAQLEQLRHDTRRRGDRSFAVQKLREKFTQQALLDAMPADVRRKVEKKLAARGWATLTAATSRLRRR